ncbi:MAG TPA: M2 family metallopeptidase [Thermoanaerobaculia bacterium]|nr:M2 family metallopeptidase [Thermoanaerobaculia bacterium]
MAHHGHRRHRLDARSPDRLELGPVALGLVMLLGAALLAVACAPPAESSSKTPENPLAVSTSNAASFVEDAEAVWLDLAIQNDRAAWVQSNFITVDTNVIAAQARERQIAAQVELAKLAAGFDADEADPVVARKLGRLVTSIVLPAPSEEAKQEELARITSEMEAEYGAGEVCTESAGEETCLDLEDFETVIDESRDPEALLAAWTGWRQVAPRYREQFRRYVELANEGARELGFADLGALWRSGYDLPPDAFAAELDRLWGQVRPLYDALHCHVRAQLAEHYGEGVVAPSAPIPAHLLGNMWAQSWGNVYDLVAPPSVDAGYELGERLRAEGYDPLEMVRTGERFFTSLGLDPLPETFWERSLFTKPADRDVVCHASAWDIDYEDDLRIKMCIEVNAEDFSTIHHELGHNYYQRAYNDQDPLFRDSANDGFHEALGDTVALSITPAYLEEIGLIDQEPPASADLALLMRLALDKVAFLPFGLLIDKFRWEVFSGAIGADEYNAGWWRLREEYQGIEAPVERDESDFDPGAKYHVAANVPYARYFLAHILQFQLHRALCAAAGVEGPLHRCSIYDNAEAGARLAEMMSVGASRPWPEALAMITGPEGGEAEMDATAILDYFAPLQEWLDEQNEGRTCGW